MLKIKTHNRGLALMVPPMVGDVHQTILDRVGGRKIETDRSEMASFGSDMRNLINRYS